MSYLASRLASRTGKGSLQGFNTANRIRPDMLEVVDKVGFKFYSYGNVNELLRRTGASEFSQIALVMDEVYHTQGFTVDMSRIRAMNDAVVHLFNTKIKTNERERDLAREFDRTAPVGAWKSSKYQLN
jgi:hypothetical protein